MRDSTGQRVPADLEVPTGVRGGRGCRTAAELDCELPRVATRADRTHFYAEARSTMKVAVLGPTDSDEIRSAEQDAIWTALEKHGLARSQVGRRRTSCPQLTLVAPAELG